MSAKNSADALAAKYSEVLQVYESSCISQKHKQVPVTNTNEMLSTPKAMAWSIHKVHKNAFKAAIKTYKTE